MKLRSSLVELLDALDELLRNVEMTGEDRELHLRWRAQLSIMLDEMLRRKLDQNTGTYTAAVEQTNKTVKIAKRALGETEEREAVILELTEAAKAIDAVIKLAV